jgi:hypothetical protein
LISRGGRDPEQFDWYQRFSGIKSKLAEYVKTSDVILHLGCGNSSTLETGRGGCGKRLLTRAWCEGLTEDMYEEGYHNIENIEISKVDNEQMKEKYKVKETSGLTCK